jgi:zinc and cadmium transporter
MNLLALYCLAIVIASLAGGMLPLATVLTHRRLQVYLSFSAGAMLGASLFHMMPEAVELGSPRTLQWAAVGLLGIYLLERHFAFHRHESQDVLAHGAHHHGNPVSVEHVHEHAPHESAYHKAATLRWSTAGFGLAVHTLTGGVALASAALGGSPSAALGVFFATILHKPADALTLTSLMLQSGVSRPMAHLVNLTFALLVPLGALLFMAGRASAGAPASAEFTGSVLAFSAGTFLCIALSDVLPELHVHDHDRVLLSVSLLAGCGLMGATGLIG